MSSQYDTGRDRGCDEASSGLAESKTVGQLEGYTDEFVRGYYDDFTCDPVKSPDTQPPSSKTGGSTPTQPSQSSQTGGSIDIGGGLIDKPFPAESSTQSPTSQGAGIDWIKT